MKVMVRCLAFIIKCRKSLKVLSRVVPGFDLFFEVLLALFGIGNQREKNGKKRNHLIGNCIYLGN